jgi:hypothetical protein
LKLGMPMPIEIADKIMPILKEEFSQIEPVPYIYKSFTEIPALIKYQQNKLNALLFAGKTAMAYTEKYVTPTIPWEYPARNGSALLQVLLQISLSNEYSISRLSMDLFDKRQWQETCMELGTNYLNAEIFYVPDHPDEGNYVDLVYQFHEQNYIYKKASCCITAFYAVHQRLKAKNIPCYFLRPTGSTIRQALHKIQLHHLVQISQQSQIAALYIQIDRPNEYSLFNDDEYQYIIDRTNVTRQIYIFAQHIKAAVVEVSVQEYLLFSTKYLLESVTNNFENIEILPSVKNHTASTISLGIGYGATAQEAKASARLGMRRASGLGGDAAFIVYDKKNIIGPIRRPNSQLSPDLDTKIDKKFLDISDKTMISVTTIFQLHSIIKHQGKNQFTSTELAELLKVSPRTVNRMITKLVQHNYCFEVGKRSPDKGGRPKRIIQFAIP